MCIEEGEDRIELVPGARQLGQRPFREVALSYLRSVPGLQYLFVLHFRSPDSSSSTHPEARKEELVPR